MQSILSDSWELDLNRGPDCLLLKLHGRIPNDRGEPNLLECIWQMLEQHFTYRIVVEFDERDHLDSRLIDQLVSLSYRVAAHGGILRLCGLSPSDCEMLRESGFGDVLPVYCCQDDAIFGDRVRHDAAHTGLDVVQADRAAAMQSAN